MNYRVHLKTDSVHLDLSEVLQSEPIVLAGVSREANDLLASIKITTVFDLALATIFANAARIVDAAGRPEAVLSRHGFVPSDAIDHDFQGTPIAELPGKPISTLVGIETLEDEIAQVLDVRSIRDLALWPPYLAAKRLLQQAFTPDRMPGFDKEAPDDLLPRTGEYATQKVLYSTTVLIKSKPSSTLTWDGSKIDLTSLDRVGFNDVAFGAVITFSQKWTPKAIALGQLLHSLPLAPGESTKLTVVDWARRVTASTEEDIDQQEVLHDTMNHATAISEITESVANEHQKGSSVSGSTSFSASAGVVGVPLVPSPVGGIMPLPVLGTASGSMNSSRGATYTVSGGTRSVAATAMQNISSSTQQNSSLTRTRRAAIVNEVSEAETETINTRNVTNYNHMHTLSIEYYEVVQVYETEVSLNRLERCIFIPMRLVNLRSEANIRRYLPILIRRSLDRETRDLLLQYRNTIVMQFAFDRFAAEDLDRLRQDVDDLKDEIDRLRLSRGFGPVVGSAVDTAADEVNPFALPEYIEKQIALRNLEQRVRSLRRVLQTNSQVAVRKRFFESFDRRNLADFNVDHNILLQNIAWEQDGSIIKVTITKTDGGSVVVTSPGDISESKPAFASAMPLDIIKSIRVTLEPGPDTRPSEYGIFGLHLLLERRGAMHWFDAGFVASRGYTGELSVLHLHSPVNIEELSDLLMANQLHYSQQIWLRADRQALLMQLAPFKYDFGGGAMVRIVDYIDPVPVTVAGNYLAFRFTYEDDAEWQTWRKNQEADVRPVVDLVPVPTGGVFAEAVLGEFNSAEKLDATRFWKWDDSPIPFKASDIEETTAGGHARISAPRPGQLPASLVSIRDLPALPQLTATSALTQAVLSAKLFNDMSGHEITSQLLQASLNAAKSGNLAAQKQAEEALGQIYAAVESLVGTFAGSGTKMIKTVTELGGALGLAGGTGAAAEGAGAAGIAGAAAEGAGIAGLAAELGPVIAELAPLLLALI